MNNMLGHELTDLEIIFNFFVKFTIIFKVTLWLIKFCTLKTLLIIIFQ